MLDALRWSPAGLHAQAIWSRWRRRGRGGERSPGRCPVCAHATTFVAAGDNTREEPVCARCGSVPRHRALLLAVAGFGAGAGSGERDPAVHLASPSLATWRHWRTRTRAGTASMYLPGRPPGARVGAFVACDLQRQPFGDGAFDLVVTEDVLEHVPDPAVALREIHRTLRRGGRHVFTVPRRRDEPTRVRAEVHAGGVRHLLPPEYHFDPSTPAGSLVVTDWGADLEARVGEATGAACTCREVHDPGAGIPAPIEVFVVQRPPHDG
jgi:SAM-dependent methyltransferase